MALGCSSLETVNSNPLIVTTLSGNCIERLEEFKPHLLDSGHFKLEIVLLIGDMRKGTSERCLASLIDREAAHWVAQDTNAGRI